MESAWTIESMWCDLYFNSKHILLTAVLALFSTACSNIYKDLTDIDDDNFRIDSTRKYIDLRDYDSAIATILPVLARQPRNEDAVYLASVSYAGKAGLSVIDLLNQLVAGLSSKGVFLLFGQHFPEATVAKVSAMETAYYIVENYGNRASLRSGHLNFYALFMYYSRIGLTLSQTALDSNGNLIPKFHGCHTTFDLSAVKSGLTNAQVDIVSTSIARIVDTASYIALDASLSSLLSSTPFPVGISFDPYCSLAGNQATVTCLAIRTLINQGKSDSGVGLGVSAGNPLPYNNGAGGYPCDTLTL
jgi:hypothetical protein